MGLTQTLERGWPPKVGGMGEDKGVRKRREFQWSKQARDLVREYKQRIPAGHNRSQADRRVLVARLVEISGNPREACLRFLRHSGIEQNRSYREWTKPEQRRLLDLITTMPVDEAAKILRRPAGSVRSMLHRLGIGGRTGREWFTRYSLSRALHTLAYFFPRRLLPPLGARPCCEFRRRRTKSSTPSIPIRLSRHRWTFCHCHCGLGIWGTRARKDLGAG